jgi:YHS domain-containing protein
MGLISGLLRYLLIGLAVWILFRVLKGWLSGPPPGQRGGNVGQGQSREAVDLMVQDPQCGVYLPQEEALRATVQGQERFFCSEACRDAYLAATKTA